MVVILVVVTTMAEVFTPVGAKRMTFMERHGHGWDGNCQRR